MIIEGLRIKLDAYEMHGAIEAHLAELVPALKAANDEYQTLSLANDSVQRTDPASVQAITFDARTRGAMTHIRNMENLRIQLEVLLDKIDMSDTYVLTTDEYRFVMGPNLKTK